VLLLRAYANKQMQDMKSQFTGTGHPRRSSKLPDSVIDEWPFAIAGCSFLNEPTPLLSLDGKTISPAPASHRRGIRTHREWDAAMQVRLLRIAALATPLCP